MIGDDEPRVYVDRPGRSGLVLDGLPACRLWGDDVATLKAFGESLGLPSARWDAHRKRAAPRWTLSAAERVCALEAGAVEWDWLPWVKYRIDQVPDPSPDWSIVLDPARLIGLDLDRGQMVALLHGRRLRVAIRNAEPVLNPTCFDATVDVEYLDGSIVAVLEMADDGTFSERMVSFGTHDDEDTGDEQS